MTKFTIFFRLLWIVAIFMILVTDYQRDNESSNYIYFLISTIILLAILTIITIRRVIESRNEWREMIDDGDVEAMEGLSYRKKIEEEINQDEK